MTLHPLPALLLSLLLLLALSPCPRAEPSAAELLKIRQMASRTTGSLADEPSRVPRVYVIGAQKGGSSSLYEMLVRHPALCGALYKEPNFFLTDRHQGTRDLRWYLSLFLDDKCLKKPHKAFVDGSCMLHGLAAALRTMNATYTPVQMASLRFVALLREPVARDYSWYKHRVRAHLLKQRPFASVRTYGECFGDDSAANPNPNSAPNTTFDPSKVYRCHARGDYLPQLRVFTQYFRRDQIFIANSQMLFTNDKSLMPALAAFLGLKMSNAWLAQFPQVDHIAGSKTPLCLARSVPLLDCATRDGLGAYYAPKTAALMQWINDTRYDHQAPTSEPPFVPFEPYTALPCVDNARAEFDRKVVLGGRAGCAAGADVAKGG